MSRDNFTAQYWFNESTKADKTADSDKKKHAPLPPFQRRLKQVEVKNLERFLIQGWSGLSLSSKKYFKALSHLETLQKDLLNTLKIENFPPKHLNQIFSEYKSFINLPSTKETTTFNLNTFALQLKDIGSADNALNDFANYYTARLIMLYFLQLRLLKTLQTKLSIPEGMKELLSPPLALNKLFAKDTVKELKAKSLQTNQYSWYRPAEFRLPQVHMLYSLSDDLSFPETLKLLYALQKQKTHNVYSHALSHLSSGLLINCLQINLPKWFQNQSSICEINYQELSAESSLYTGDYLEELSVSHWLAQDNNKTFGWDEIICPHFSNEQDSIPEFNFYYHELQLLQLLSEIQVHYDTPLLEFIVKTFKEWQKNLDSGFQRDLFDDSKLTKYQKYDHVILSVLQQNKTNPHHQLIQKINHAANDLKDGKYLIVLSRQNLFIPSQAEKIDNLIKTMMPMCIIDMNQLKGKGEAPDYIYVFKKKHGLEKSYSTSQICSTFRFHGQIDTFQNFCNVPEELNAFFQRFFHTIPTIYKSPNNDKLPFEFDFFQNAIVNGVLLHSSDQEGQHITHPHFLKKLLHNAMPLNYFFDIQHVDGKNLTDEVPTSWRIEQKLPMAQPFSTDLSEYSEFSLILDLRDSVRPKLELINRNLLKSKAYEYGISECFYYNLAPKLKKINLRIFREYLRSNLGKQICAISLLGNKNQIRSKITSLLIPNLLIKGQSLFSRNIDLDLSFDAMHSSLSSIINTKFAAEQDLIEGIEKASVYQDKLELLIEKAQVEKENYKEFNFNTPEVKPYLLKLNLNPIYPNNHELNIDFCVHDINRANNIIDKHELVFESVISKITLICNNTAVATISGNTPLIIFIHFLLRQIPPMKILDFLTNVKVPSSFDCTSMLQLKDLQLKKLTDLHGNCSKTIEQLLHQGITR